MEFLEYLQVFGGNVWLYGGTFVLVLSLLVFVHEWGHYIVARLCGVRVESFSIGFGPEIGGYNDKHGTRWKVSLIPLGGYVKLFGDTDPASAQHDDAVEEDGQKRPMTEAEKKVAFFAQPVWACAAIVFAGPAINYVFAAILLTISFTFVGEPVTAPSAAAVMVDSSAYNHGFLPHDKVVEIDGSEITSFEQIRRAMMIGLDTEKHFVIERDGERIDIHAKPEKVEMEDRFGFKQSRGLLGIISSRHAIDVKTISSVDGRAYSEDNREALLADLKSRLGQSFTVTVPTSEGEDALLISPSVELNTNLGVDGKDDRGVLYISDKGENRFERYSLPVAFVHALGECWDVTYGTLEAIGQMFTGVRSASELGGVIRIGALAGDVAQQGFVALVLFTALLSINLGLINLFPVPLLDGGHLFFYAIESVAGKPVPEPVQEYAFRFGIVFLVGVMAYANLNDIMQLIL